MYDLRRISGNGPENMQSSLDAFVTPASKMPYKEDFN